MIYDQNENLCTEWALWYFHKLGYMIKNLTLCPWSSEKHGKFWNLEPKLEFLIDDARG